MVAEKKKTNKGKLLHWVLEKTDIYVNSGGWKGMAVSYARSFFGDTIKSKEDKNNSDLENQVLILTQFMEKIKTYGATREELTASRERILKLFGYQSKSNLSREEMSILRNLDGSKRSVDELMDLQGEKLVSLFPHFFGDQVEPILSDYADISELSEDSFDKSKINVVGHHKGNISLYRLDRRDFGLILKGFLGGRKVAENDLEMSVNGEGSLIINPFDNENGFSEINRGGVLGVDGKRIVVTENPVSYDEKKTDYNKMKTFARATLYSLGGAGFFGGVGYISTGILDLMFFLLSDISNEFREYPIELLDFNLRSVFGCIGGVVGLCAGNSFISEIIANYKRKQ